MDTQIRASIFTEEIKITRSKVDIFIYKIISQFHYNKCKEKNQEY